MTSIGNTEEYKPDEESIIAYLELVELLNFAANNIEDDKTVIDCVS